MKKTYYLYADLETTTVEIPDKYKNYGEYYQSVKNPKVPKIYSWGIAHNPLYSSLFKDYEMEYDEIRDIKYTKGISGASFIHQLELLDVDAIMYWNNLKGYDGHFIVPLLDKLGYEQVYPLETDKYETLPPLIKQKWLQRIEKIKELILKSKKNREIYEDANVENKDVWLAEQIKKKWDYLLEGEYKLMVNGNHQIYEIKIGLKSQKRTKGNYKHRVLILRDNLLLFPTSIANMGEIVAKYHIKFNNMDPEVAKKKYHKMDLDSNYNRTTLYKSIEEFENDGNEVEYLIQDIFILHEYHILMDRYFPRKHWKLTAAGMSYAEWIRIFGDELVTKFMDNGEVEEVDKKGMIFYKYKEKTYKTMNLYKVLINKILPTKWMSEKLNPEDEEDTELIHHNIYTWYSGGLTLVNEKYRGQFVEDLTVLDINSSYPSQMVKDTLVPIGRGVKGDKKGYDFKLYNLIPLKDIKNTKGLPFMHNHYSINREYLSTLKRGQLFKLNSIELEYFKKYYSANSKDYILQVEWSFNAIPIRNIFGGYINKWYSVKEDASKDNNPVLKNIAKLFLNSLYGKFGTKIDRESRLWNPEDQCWESITDTTESSFYLPLALAITSLARMSLVDAVDKNYDKFVYADTDSIFVTGFKKDDYNIDLNPDKLGAWDIEFENGYGVARRPKQYYFKNKKGKVKIAFAGINFNRWYLSDEELEEMKKIEENFKQLKISDYITGKTIDKQLSPERVLGYGILLTDTEKSIKPVWEYKPLSEQIYFEEKHFQKTLELLEQINE